MTRISNIQQDAETLKRFSKKENKNKPNFFIAEVVDTSPLTVKRIGANDSSAFTVKRLSSYTAVVADIVLISVVDGIKIIQGEIV